MNDFFAALYEFITGQGTELSKLLYDESVYSFVGVFMVIFSGIGMVIYYYVINHPRFARWFHWLIVVTIVCLINFAIAYFKADGIVYDTYGTSDDYITQMVTFAFANVILTIIAVGIISALIKWGSSNCKHSPL
jgi:hypothetical protein